MNVNTRLRGKMSAEWAIRLIPVALIVSLLFAFLPVSPIQASDPWWDTDWAYRTKLTFNNSGGEVQTNKEVLINLDSTKINYSKFLANGQDIRVVDSDGTLLSSINETWDDTGVSRFWTRIPQIDASDTDYVYLYYGNPGASANWSTPANVYDTNLQLYTPLWRSDESSSSFTTADQNGLTATVTGTTWGSTGRTFDGNDDVISYGSAASLQVQGAAFSVGAWFYRNTDLDDSGIIGWDDPNPAGGFNLVIDRTQAPSGANIDLQKAKVIDQTKAYTFSTATWYQVWAVQNYAEGAPSNVEYFVNGLSIGTVANTSAYNAVQAGQTLNIGRWVGVTIDAIVGEALLYDRALSAAEIAIEYDATKYLYGGSADTFITYGSVEIFQTIATNAASSITSSSANISGDIMATSENVTVNVYWGTTDGGSDWSSWSNNSTPTSPSQPQGVAAFYLDVTGLSPATLYYFSASANNSVGTSWPLVSGNFTTLAVAPTVTTQAATDITTTTATGNGNITNTGGENPSVRGFQWGTSTGVYTTNVTEAGSFGTGAYTLSLTSLPPSDTVYYRSMATNSIDTSYGSELTFVTLTPPVVAPSGLTLTAVGNGQVSISWAVDATTNATMIRRQVFAYPFDRTDGLQVYSGSASSVNDTSVDLEYARYYYRAYAQSMYDGTWSEPDSAVIGGTGLENVATQIGVLATAIAGLSLTDYTLLIVLALLIGLAFWKDSTWLFIALTPGTFIYGLTLAIGETLGSAQWVIGVTVAIMGTGLLYKAAYGLWNHRGGSTR